MTFWVGKGILGQGFTLLLGMREPVYKLFNRSARLNPATGLPLASLISDPPTFLLLYALVSVA